MAGNLSEQCPSNLGEVKKLKPEGKDTTFRKKYVYFKIKPEEDAKKLGNLNTVIFGLHEKSGEKLFEKFEKLAGNDASTKGQILPFRAKKIPKQRDKERKIPFNYDGQSHDVLATLFVSPTQYAVYSLSSTVHEVRQRYQNAVRCFIVVFDANFVRFSSDVKDAMDKLEWEFFGVTVWKNAILVILNADDVIGEGTLYDYLNRVGNENLKHYADRMEGRVIALPTFEDDYDVKFQMNELMRVILTIQSDYQPFQPTTLWGKVRRLSST